MSKKKKEKEKEKTPQTSNEVMAAIRKGRKKKKHGLTDNA